MSRKRISETPDLSFDDFDEVHYPRPLETDFGRLVERAVSRRGFLGGSVAFGAAAFVASAGALRPLSAHAADRFGFDPVAANTLDTVTVPPGYNWHVVVRWGDPMWSNGVEFDQATRGTGESQELAFGDNNDGMALYAHDGRSVLAVNNEYVNRKIMYGGAGSGSPANADDVRKGKAGHGVSVVEIESRDGTWSIVKDSPYNRKITADAPMEITGPARGHDLLKTAADPDGVSSLGTWNNCGNGRTPWGTYLACEENFNGYFSSSDPEIEVGAALKRYGVGPKDRGYAWATADERFDIAKHPNEPNRAGYVVEIDPLDPGSTPKKRTALGRFKHENAEVVVAANGQVVVYMGDDERGEFLYKFVSDGQYAEGGDNSNLLESGRLFAARFADGGRGEWAELTPESAGMASAAEVAIHTRMAASAVGATTMDRPEWVAASPMKAEVYCCLTNNKNRGKKPNAGGDPTPVGGAEPPRRQPLRPDCALAAGRRRPPRDRLRLGPLRGGGQPDGPLGRERGLGERDPGQHVQLAGRARLRQQRDALDPDGWKLQGQGRVRRAGQQPDAGRRFGERRDPPLPGGSEGVRGHRHHLERRPEDPLHRASAPRREGRHQPLPDGGDTVPRSAVIAIARDDGGAIG